MKNGITILGLGPGDIRLLSLEAWEIINNASEIYLRTRNHPAVEGFPKKLVVQSFDSIYDEQESFTDVYSRIIDKVLELANQPGGVIYAVPGHPFVAEATCPEICIRAKELGIPVRVCQGISFLEPVFSSLSIDPFDGISLVDALDLIHQHHPPFPPNRPVLVAQIYDPFIASEVKLTLMNLYPDQHLVKMVHHAGTDDCIIEEVPLFEIDRSKLIGMFTVLYLPSLGEQTAFEGLQEITAHLRAPEGCPWDQEQTFESMRPHILEETYELLNAIDESEAEKVKEEIGDLLLVLTMLIQIGHEEGAFSSAEVVEKISHKLIGRHPHVFSGLDVGGAIAVLENWERIKAQERIINGQEDKSLLDGVAISLPALNQAQEFQDRAARVGFDWPDIGQVWGKFNEEVVELQEATDFKNRSDEVGDLIFALVNLARWYKVDAESSLRQANKRFRSRFGFIEREARNQGRELLDMSLEEMDSLWERAKGLQS